MLSLLENVLIFFVFFGVLPFIYIILFIKFIGWVLNIKSSVAKILILLGIILLLPVIIYIHMIAIYAAGGGH